MKATNIIGRFTYKFFKLKQLLSCLGIEPERLLNDKSLPNNEERQSEATER